MRPQELLDTIKPLTGTGRDLIVLAHQEAHVQWDLREVPITGPSGETIASIYVTSDVFAIGSPEAPVRVPLTGPGAQALADQLSVPALPNGEAVELTSADTMLLPTRRMASLIYKAACRAGEVVLKPQPMGPPQYAYDETMCTTERFQVHNEWVEEALNEKHADRSLLVVGHKKDVVATNRLRTQAGALAIYGWFKGVDNPIQKDDGPHPAGYADYSHGIRLVHPWMKLNGEYARVADVLRDPTTAGILSDEGVMDVRTCRYEALPEYVLARGSKGDAVKVWQQALAAWGVLQGRVDGDFGPKTEASTRAFQAKCGLPQDGKVSAEMWDEAQKVVAYAAGVFGADVSSLVSRQEWEALKDQQGVRFAIVRCHCSNGPVDKNALANLQNAHDAGIDEVDVYHFPDYREDAEAQVNEVMDALAAKGGRWHRFWIDVEDGSHWSNNPAANAAFLRKLIDTAESKGLSVGIYTSAYFWNRIMKGDSSFSAYPLWYAQYKTNQVLGDTSNASFNDFHAFGGWGKPAVKQYQGDMKWNGVVFDMDWRPAETPA